MKRAICIALLAWGLLGPGAKGVAMDALAPMGRAVFLGQPCRARQILGGTVVRDRKTGRELVVLTNMNEAQGAELIFLDVDRDRARVVRMPTGAGSWNVREVPGDRLVIGTFYDGSFVVYDLRAERFSPPVRFGKEEYLWNTAIGSDGRIYAGSYPGGRLGALDLDTMTVEDCGAPAPPNMYLRHVSATHDGRIFCSFSAQDPVEKLYDPRTRTWSDVPDPLKGTHSVGVWDGCTFAGSRLFAGPDLTPVEPTFPTPPPEGGPWAMDATLTTSSRLILRQGRAVYGWRKGEPQLTKLAEVELRGGRYLAVVEDGRLVGVRGQDYFVCRPGENTLKLRPIPGESSPRSLFFLRVDPQGRVWSGAPFGQTLTYFNPRTRKAVNTRTICDSGGEVYDVAFRDGCVYAVSYSGGDIVVYDPRKPWDQWNNRNPRTLASVSPGYIRPTGGAVFGHDGMLYSGWMAAYGRYGGAVAITDPSSGKTRLIENPLGEQAVSGLAVDTRPERKLAYVGTALWANGLPNKEGESPKFGVLDLEKGTVSYSCDFPGAASVRSVLFDPGTNLVVFVAGTALKVFDPDRSEFLDVPEDMPLPQTPLAWAPPHPASRAKAVRRGGMILYGSGPDLIAFDLRQRSWSKLATAPVSIEKVAVSATGVVYAASGPSLYTIVFD